MITEDYVSYEVAKLLKEKGFDEPTTKSYYTEGFENPMIFSHDLLPCIRPDEFLCPTLQMVMKWLRKIYSLEIYPYHDFQEVGDKWWFEIIKYPNSVSEHESESIYNSYEQACETAIKYCLEKLI